MVPTPKPFSAAILAGGASRRMGTDKAFLEVDGRPMLAWVGDALVKAGAERIAAVGHPDDAAVGRLGFDVVLDRWPGEGPLGGLISALRWSPEESCVVVACDTPGLTVSALARLVSARDLGDDCDVAMIVSPSGREPLFAVWSPSAADPLATAFEMGERAIHRAVEPLLITEVPMGEVDVPVNVNAPIDLEAEVESRRRRARG